MAKKISYFILIVSLSFVLTLLFIPLEASKNLKGKSFTDPSHQVQMPEEWVKQSLQKKHEGLAINLDQQIFRMLVVHLKEYAKEHNLKLTITDSTCGNSSGMLRHKMIDIGGYCCPPGKMDRLPGLRFHTSGITPVAFIVHPDNPIDNISTEQARKIFMGEIRKWSELKTSDGRPGPDVEIKPIGRLHCKTRPGHWRLLLDNENLFSLVMSEVGTIPDMISRVAAEPHAIGHAALWLATEYYKNEGKVNLLKIDGHAPGDLDFLLNGKYPAYKTFNITTWEGKGVENPDAEKLADFILKQVEQLDERYKIIPSSRLRKAGWKFKDNELVGDLLN